jgi:hypothetical protein
MGAAMATSFEVAIGGLALIDVKNGEVYLLDCDGHSPLLSAPLDLIQNKGELAAANQTFQKRVSTRTNPLTTTIHPDGRAYVTFPLTGLHVKLPASEGLQRVQTGVELDLDFLTGNTAPAAPKVASAAARVSFNGGLLSAILPTGLGARNLWELKSSTGETKTRRLASAFSLRKTIAADNCQIEIVHLVDDSPAFRLLLRSLPDSPMRLSAASLCPFEYSDDDASSMAADVREYERFYDGVTILPPRDVSEMTYKNNPVCPPGTTEAL